MKLLTFSQTCSDNKSCRLWLDLSSPLKFILHVHERELFSHNSYKLESQDRNPFQVLKYFCRFWLLKIEILCSVSIHLYTLFAFIYCHTVTCFLIWNHCAMPLMHFDIIYNWLVYPVAFCSLVRMSFATKPTCALYPSLVRRFWTPFKELRSKLLVQIQHWTARSSWWLISCRMLITDTQTYTPRWGVRNAAFVRHALLKRSHTFKILSFAVLRVGRPAVRPAGEVPAIPGWGCVTPLLAQHSGTEPKHSKAQWGDRSSEPAEHPTTSTGVECTVSNVDWIGWLCQLLK